MNNWDPRVNELFIQAIELVDPAERAAVLDRLGDAELRCRVETLLKAHDEAGGFLREPHPAADAGEQTGAYVASTPSEEKPGAVVAGRYKLLERIGEGGMGAVWMADQTEPVKRRVAVKLIRSERDGSASILSRFEAERQAIALMDHPNIAKLLDAGKTDSGAPFFVMELVKGSPLTEFCDEHRLNVSDRLTLFIQICSAVQHAHQKGIIHRDLKPTNILVEMHDDKPVPKVIDFGLAKAMSGQPLTERTLFTGFGTVAGTPLYMAPEQAKFNAVDVDTRADIYALGVILYELLTGSTPIERATFKQAALDEMLRMIRESDPPTPSKRLSSTDASPSIAASRQMEPAVLGSFVKGELDWIVMKALAKERDRRYETANGFAKDVERFLNHEPVSAGPPKAGYKLRKFVQRNRGAVAAAGVVLAALLGGLVMLYGGVTAARYGLKRARVAETAARADKEEAVQQRNEADRQRRDADTQRAIAVEQRTKAEKARDRTRDVLDAMTSSVTGDSLSTQQELSADQMKFLAEVLTYYREFAGEKTDDEQTRAHTANAALRVGLIENRLGRRQQAIAASQMARDGYRTLAADFPAVADYQRELARSYNNLGVMLSAVGKRTEAEEQYLQALAVQTKLAADFLTVPQYRRELANQHNNLGAALTALGKREAAEEQYLQALAIQTKLTADFPTVPQYQQELANHHNNLGAAFTALGKREAAEEQYLQALAIQTKLTADFPTVPEFRHELARSHNNLGILLARMEKRAQAEEQYRKVLTIRQKLSAEFPTVPDYQLDLGASYCNYGNLLRAGGRAGESLVWLDKAVATLAPVHRAEPRDVRAKQYLRDGYWGRARAYETLAKHSDAVKDWDRTIELSPPAEQPRHRANRLSSRLEAGMVAEAVAEVVELTKSSNWNADQWYNFACIYVLAGGKINEKNQEYADRAMELLHKAVKAGYKNAVHMKKDTDLDPLRERADFKKLLTELDAKSAPTKNSDDAKKPTK